MHVESLVNYHESVDLILGRLTERSGKLPERILLLFSVCSTGSLATKLHNACLNAGCSDLTTVRLVLPGGRNDDLGDLQIFAAPRTFEDLATLVLSRFDLESARAIKFYFVDLVAHRYPCK